MKISIKDQEQKLILTDDEFDVYGWVHLVVEDKEIDIHINDLYPAVLAFMEKYKLIK
jgi:hypothetical protein